MNKTPVSYMQTDARWKGRPYAVPGESSTIGAAGCGPTSAAMLIATLADASVTPAETAAWALKNGYKALRQGTYYSYFGPQFAAHGIECRQLNAANIYGKPGSGVHDEALALLERGFYLIACMGKGTWTSAGHFVVVWREDGKVRILDPASRSAGRTNGDLPTFRNEVKYYWAVDAREHNKEDDMTEADVRKIITAHENESDPVYSTVEDVPDYWREDVQTLLDAGAIEGTGAVPVGIRRSALKAMIVGKRYTDIVTARPGPKEAR